MVLLLSNVKSVMNKHLKLEERKPDQMALRSMVQETELDYTFILCVRDSSPGPASGFICKPTLWFINLISTDRHNRHNGSLTHVTHEM